MMKERIAPDTWDMGKKSLAMMDLKLQNGQVYLEVISEPPQKEDSFVRQEEMELFARGRSSHDWHVLGWM